jgi:hypothetical protein
MSTRHAQSSIFPAEDGRRSVHAGELDVRPPLAEQLDLLTLNTS